MLLKLETGKDCRKQLREHLIAIIKVLKRLRTYHLLILLGSLCFSILLFLLRKLLIKREQALEIANQAFEDAVSEIEND